MFQNDSGTRKTKKIIAALLMVPLLLALLGGCGKGNADTVSGGGTDQMDAASDGAGKDAGGEAADGSQTGSSAMGRYVEETIDVSSYLNRPFGVTALEDDRLVILDAYAGMVVSEDNGVTWEAKGILGMDDFASFDDTNYIWEMEAASDGTVAILYSNTENWSSEGDYAITDLDYELMLLYPDGTGKSVTLAKPDEGNSVSDIFFSPSGEIFALANGKGPYLVDTETGSLSRYMTASAHLDHLAFLGDYLMMLSKEEGIQIYDRQKESFVADDVLSDFMKECYLKNDYDIHDIFSVYFFPAEENCIYVAGKEGLHRHVIGGSVMEQVIDGNLSSFSNPSFGLQGVVMLPDNMFLALFSPGTVIRYGYRDDIPAVPEDRLSVYSLKDDDTVRMGIAKYQTDHPEVFVDYEVGMEEGSAVTREDALKNLNTRMLSGEGPDILIMDGMPIDSYVEKGMLMDIRDYVEKINAETTLMSNVLEGFTEDGHIYMLPATFQISVLVGDADEVKGIKDLNGLKNEVESLRRKYPGKEIMGLYSEEVALREFMPTSVPAWETEGGNIDRTKIKDYLETVKKIYETANDGISEKAKQAYQRRREIDMENDTFYNSAGRFSTSYLAKDMVLLAGDLPSVYNYHELISLKYRDGLENTVMVPMNGQSNNIFVPYTLMAVSSVCPNPDLAADFLATVLSEDVQGLIWNGFVVNEQALRDQIGAEWGLLGDLRQAGYGPGEPYSSMAFADENGVAVSFDIYMPTDAEAKELFDMLGSMDTMYIADPVIEDAIISAGVSYLRGSLSLDEAVNDIETKISIYLAE